MQLPGLRLHVTRLAKTESQEEQEAPKGVKPGDAYQNAVAQVAKRLVPTGQIEVGVWVEGPDGMRELDVRIHPPTGQLGLPVVVECKDWSRPIDVQTIDALESKRRDIGASLAMICSNSGFTEQALRKAARVGIPTLAALIEGDSRIRVVIHQQIYTPIVTFMHHRPVMHHQNLPPDVQATLAGMGTGECIVLGKSLESWVASKLFMFAAAASRARSFVARYAFREPISIGVRGVTLLVTQIDIRAAFTVQWMTQVAEIGASEGMYDYLRKVVVFGPGQHQFHLKNVNSETWGTPIDVSEVPPHLLKPPSEWPRPAQGSIEMFLRMVKNISQADMKDAPDLDSLIDEEDVVDDPAE